MITVLQKHTNNTGPTKQKCLPHSMSILFFLNHIVGCFKWRWLMFIFTSSIHLSVRDCHCRNNSVAQMLIAEQHNAFRKPKMSANWKLLLVLQTSELFLQQKCQLKEKGGMDNSFCESGRLHNPFRTAWCTHESNPSLASSARVTPILRLQFSLSAYRVYRDCDLLL